MSVGLAGWAWPREWLHTILDPAAHPYAHNMPGLRVLAQSVPGMILVTVIVASLGLALWRTAARQPIENAFALALAAGIIANVHSYLIDCVLLLPATALALRSRWLSERLIGLVLATRLPFLALLLGHAEWLQAGTLALVELHAWRGNGPSTVEGVEREVVEGFGTK